MKKKLHRPILFFFTRFIAAGLSLLPRNVALWLGRHMGRVAYGVLPKERKKAYESLTVAFGDTKTEEEKEDIIREMFLHLGENVFEWLMMPRLSEKQMDRIVEVRGFEKVKAMIEAKKGFVVISAHLGNWEMISGYFGKKGYHPTVIGKRIYYHRYNNGLVNMRARMGVNTLYRDEAFRPAVRILRNGGFVAVLADQDVDSVEGVFVDFLGKPAYTPIGPAIFAMTANVPMVPVFIVRQGKGHIIFFDEIIPVIRTGDRQKDIIENTRTWNRVVESYILRYPQQWVWLHRRWKTQKETVEKE